MRISPVRPVAPPFGEMLSRYRDEIRARSAHLPVATAASLGGTGWRKPTPAERPVANDSLWRRNGEIA